MLENAKGLPAVSEIKIEYTFQGDGQPFATDITEYNEDWLMGKVGSYLQYWHKERDPVGVDIEEAWKCSNCVYSDDCAWRTKKNEELQMKNRAKLN